MATLAPQLLRDRHASQVRQGSTFNTTHWSVVILAGQTRSPESAVALEQLCQAYWSPLYAFVRRQGYAPDEAKDLTQDFFLHVLSKDALTKVDPEKGRFRSFLLASIKNLLANDWHRAHARKRGGDAPILSLDEQLAEEHYQAELVHQMTPDRLFDRRWAETLLERVLLRLRENWNARDRQRRFDDLKVFLVEPRGAVPVAAVAARLGITVSALRSMLHRLRESYRDIFTQEIAHTVSSPDEVEGEIRHLLAALSDG